MTGAQPELGTSRALSTDADEVNHLVCCREEWKFAFCGTNVENVPVNVRSLFVCVMCLEVVRGLRPTFDEDDPPICPRDGTPCPDELEIDARIMYETR